MGNSFKMDKQLKKKDEKKEEGMVCFKNKERENKYIVKTYKRKKRSWENTKAKQVEKNMNYANETVRMTNGRKN